MTNRKEDDFEEESVHRGADHPRLAAGRVRYARRRGLPQVGHHRAGLLPVAAQICRDGDRRAAPPPAGRGGEPPAQAAGRRPHPRQAHAPGGAPKKLVKPAQKRAVVAYFRTGFRVSERRACRVAGVPRSTCRYRGRAQDQAALRVRLRDLAAARVRYGYRRLHVLLRREGWRVNHKRIYRLYREEGLGIRVKRRKKLASVPRLLPPPATRPLERWSLDFLSDSLANGRRFRVLTIVDNVSRVSPAIEVGSSLTGERVVRLLEGLRVTVGV